MPTLHQWARETTEAIVDAVTASLAAPSSLLLGRYDDDGRLRYTGRTTTLARTVSTPRRATRPDGERSSVDRLVVLRRWGSRDTLDVTLVEPELVGEVGVDVARDASGRWRHPARWHRARPGLSPADVPRWTSPPH
jgi:hypothetical protein